MKAISLHAPYPHLVVTRQPHDFNRCHCDQWGRCLVDCPTSNMPMVKRFETRSWPCPPSIIGQHVAFASTKQKPTRGVIGDYIVADEDGANPGLVSARGHGSTELPLGCVVGSGIITASYPIIQFLSRGPGHEPLPSWTPYVEGQHPHPCVGLNSDASRFTLYTAGQATDISDQLPYGDWTPGRYAWQIENAAPTTERCPWCRGDGGDPDSYESLVFGAPEVATKACRVCGSNGRCDPIPVTGHQGFWNWQP